RVSICLTSFPVKDNSAEAAADSHITAELDRPAAELSYSRENLRRLDVADFRGSEQAAKNRFGRQRLFIPEILR
ncbi:hypothetical protein OFC13_30340, partial [Escherichia coli]|nr:hypothetical protein [Escherichia coli]